MRRLTYANVMSTVAVFLALGGISWAAVKLPRNSVGSKQIKKGAVRSSDVKNGALTLKDFRSGQVPSGPTGPKGDPGQPGAPGLPGTARAHLEMNSVSYPEPVEGTVKGVEEIDFSLDSYGVWCVTLDFDDPAMALAAPGDVETIATATTDPLEVEYYIFKGECSEETDVIVQTARVEPFQEELTTREWRPFSLIVE